MKRVVAVIIPVFLFMSGCDTCNPDEEPLIRIKSFALDRYERVYGVGRPDQPINENRDQEWDLPVSLVNDYSSFVFENGNTRDTITFMYKREAKLESNACGIRVFLSDMKVGEPNSFARAEVSPTPNGGGLLFGDREKKYSASVY